MGRENFKHSISKLKSIIYKFDYREGKFHKNTTPIWASVTVEAHRQLFSRFGVGAMKRISVITHQNSKINELTPIEYKGNTYIVSSCELSDNRLFLDIIGARADIKSFTCFSQKKTVDQYNEVKWEGEEKQEFDGFLVEKYQKAENLEFYGEEEQGFILMTMKDIVLPLNSMISYKDERLIVKLAHKSDDNWNEYEVYFVRDI